MFIAQSQPEILEKNRIMKNIIILFLLFLSNFNYSQRLNNKGDYTKIDDYSKTIKYKSDILELVSDLTKDCNTDLQKSRAIYIWITENISYDYKTFNKKKRTKVFKCKTNEECELKKTEWKNKFINRVLRKKKGVCAGYSELYKKMCNIAGIKCEVIEGYIKTEPSQIGKMGVLDHAWNTLIIDNNYYYLDLTWASGYCTKNKKNELNKFVKQRDEYYWITPIDKISRSHFPKDTLQLVNSKYNKKLFKSNPYIQNSILPKIEMISPYSGIINAKIGDTIKFSFKYSETIEKLQINTNILRNPKIWKVINNEEVFDEKAFGKQKYIDFEKENEIYKFNYIVGNKSIRFMEILFEHKLALKYLVKITE